MRLLIFSQYFWPETFGINSLARALAERGQKLSVLTGKPNYPEGRIFEGYTFSGIQRENHDGIEVVRVPLIPRGNRSSLRLALNYLSFILSGYILAPFALRGRRFDIVFVYAPSPLLQALPAIFLAWLKRAPLVVWVQDLWPESLTATGFIHNRFMLRVVEIAVRYIYRHSDLILIQSEAFRSPVSKMTKDARKIRYFPNSADAFFFQHHMEGKESAPSDLVSSIRGNFSIVFTGNVGTAQSLETIIGAADRLRDHPEICFFVVGGGSRLGWLEAEVQLRKLDNIVLVGRLPFSAMPEVLSAASVLLATLSDEPIFAFTIPSKVQAYLAAGRPIIVCMNGEGARVLCEARAGIACGAGDSVALAEAVLQMQRLTPQERAQLGENGRRYFAEQYESGKLVEQLIEYLESLRVGQDRSVG